MFSTLGFPFLGSFILTVSEEQCRVFLQFSLRFPTLGSLGLFLPPIFSENMEEMYPSLHVIHESILATLCVCCPTKGKHLEGKHCNFHLYLQYAIVFKNKLCWINNQNSFLSSLYEQSLIAGKGLFINKSYSNNSRRILRTNHLPSTDLRVFYTLRNPGFPSLIHVSQILVNFVYEKRCGGYGKHGELTTTSVIKQLQPWHGSLKEKNVQAFYLK